ncbi:MAG: hypothetical protein U0401_20535 [Anaerolineae bacterium]
MAVDSANNRLLVIEHDGTQVSLRALDSAGRPAPTPAPFILSDDIYSDPRLTLAGSQIAVANRTLDAYSLQIINAADLSLSTQLPIPSYPTGLAADPATNRVYLSYSGSPDYVLAVDPLRRSRQIVFTSLTIRDALADPASGRLYLLNNQGTLQVLSLSDYRELGHLETSANVSSFNTERLKLLSLDPARRRLYLSGNPVQVIDTESLRVSASLDRAGQLIPDPAGNRLYLTPPCNCRTEVCNTFILNADTLSGNATLFSPQDVLAAPCVFATNLDETNRLLYAQIYNGVPGSNSGDFFKVFDVTGPPRELYTANDISFGRPALDPVRARAFVPRFRMSQPFLYRFEAQGQTFTQTLQLSGAAGTLTYDPRFDRLYSVLDTTLQVFDGDLALLSEIPLPGPFSPLTFDSEAQRLYLTDRDGNLLIVAAGGGQPAPPPQPRVPPASPPPPPSQLFIAPNGDYFQIYNSQLYRAGANSQNWELLGQGLPDKYVTTLAISPNFQSDRTLLVALSGPDWGGSLYRSSDGGDTWLPATRGLTDLKVKQIVFSPTFGQDQTIFLSGETGGLYRSGNGGDTWQPLAATYTDDPANAQVTDIAVSPNFGRDGLVLISAGTIRRSTDGGATWDDTGLPAGLIAFSPDFARDGLVLSEGRWRSSDGGQSWQPTAAGLAPNRGAVRLLFSPTFAADQTIYLLARRDYNQPDLLQRSVDAGRSWQTSQDSLPADFNLYGVTILADGSLYLTPQTGQPLTLSPQQMTWGRPVIEPAQLDLQALAVAAEGTIYVANSAAGVFKSADSGRAWQDTNFPARADETDEARLALTNNGVLFAAVGRALERSADGGQQWDYLPLPPGFEVTALAVSPTFAPDGVVLVGGNYQTKQILRSADGGQSWQGVFDGTAYQSASDIGALAFSPNFASDRTVYAWLQYAGLLRSSDGGRRWQLVPGDKNGVFAQSLLVAPTGRLYLGALGGGLYASDDGGQSWLDFSANIPDSRQWSRALTLTPDNWLFLGSEVGLYRSGDGGQSWSRADAGLPLDPANSSLQGVRALRFSGGRLYAALVSGGVFVSTDGGQSWQSVATAPPLAPSSPPPPPIQPTPPRLFASPPPPCPTPPANFADLWAGRIAQLGCPTGSQRPLMAEQSFEGGLMFWRSDTRSIYVLPFNQPYASFADTWDESQPVYLCPEFGPPQTPPTPQRGFGKIWCAQPQLRQLLGRATGQERPFAALIQEFATGLILQTDQGVIYIFENGSNRWEEIK